MQTIQSETNQIDFIEKLFKYKLNEKEENDLESVMVAKEYKFGAIDAGTSSLQYE
jgi:hypothetical protein